MNTLASTTATICIDASSTLKYWSTDWKIFFGFVFVLLQEFENKKVQRKNFFINFVLLERLRLFSVKEPSSYRWSQSRVFGLLSRGIGSVSRYSRTLSQAAPVVLKTRCPRPFRPSSHSSRPSCFVRRSCLSFLLSLRCALQCDNCNHDAPSFSLFWTNWVPWVVG